MNYYPFHIGDFRAGTSNMSRQARWIYRDMLDVYYDTEKPLPLDFEDLCEKLGVEIDDERRIVERLLRFKFAKTEQGYHHHICETVIADYHKKAEAAVTNGKLGGRPRKPKGDDSKPKNNPKKPSGLGLGSVGLASGSDQVSSGLANETQGKANVTQVKANETRSQANQEPITNNQEPVNPVDAPTQNPQRMRGGATPVELSIAMRKRGVNTQPADPRLIAMSEQGIGVETVDSACEEARRSLGAEATMALGYVVKILERWTREGRSMSLVGAAPPRAAQGGYESVRDRERRETLEGLTGKRNDPDPEIIDIN